MSATETALAEKNCAACEGGANLLADQEVRRMKSELDSDWQLANNKSLERDFKFKNFKEALAFTNRIGEVAEQEGHHPDLCLGWGYVKVQLSTHSAGGLTENDFILAAKIDRLE